MAALESIADYIAEDNPDRASSFVQELYEKAFDLADLPRRFPIVLGEERRGIRRRAHGSYLILYEIEGEAITILTVAHSAQDYMRGV